MQIAAGFEMLAITADVMGAPKTVHPVVLWDDKEIILVDAGFPGQLPLIRAAMENAGVPFGGLTKVIITHHDVDHMGSLKSILTALPRRPVVIAHEAEKPYIQGNKQPLKLAQLAPRLASLPAAMQDAYERMAAFYQDGTAAVTATVADGERLPWCGGIDVIHTPGHTLGHICLYVRRSRTLIAGDAVMAEGGRLVKTPVDANCDAEQYARSLRKLTAYDIDAIVCYHGGLCREDAGGQLAALAAAAAAGRT